MKRKKLKISKAIRSQYENYSRKFTIERKRGNIVRNQRKATLKQFATYYREETTKEGKRTFGARLLRVQKKFKTEAQMRHSYKLFKELTQDLKRGQTTNRKVITVNAGFIDEEKLTLNYREKVSSFAKNIRLHDLITLRIMNGENREKVLADYGY